MVGRQVLKRLKELDSLSNVQADDDDSNGPKLERVWNRFSLLEVQELDEEADEEVAAVDSQQAETTEAPQYGAQQPDAKAYRAKQHRKKKGKGRSEDAPLTRPAPKDKVDKVHTGCFCLPVSVRRLNYQTERSQMLRIRQYSTNRDHSRTGIGRGRQLVNPEEYGVAKIEIVMNCIDGDRTYKYEHLSPYKEVEQSFIDNLSSADGISTFIRTHVNHANSMLLMSEIFATGQEYEDAIGWIERCICLLQKRFHPHFQLQCDPDAGRVPSLLPYKYYENRIFHIALFRHALFLHNRSLSRTALEMAKILLNTDPSDPLAVVLVIDLYAVRANELQFLVTFYEQCRERYLLDNLPGMAFHHALALFKLERCEEARERMRSAIGRFPAAFRLLLDRLSVEPDPKVERMLQGLPEDPIPLKIINFLFADRIYRSAWTSPGVLQLMEESARGAVLVQNSNNELYVGTTPDRVRRHVAISGLTTDAVNRALRAMLTERAEWTQWADTFDPMCPFNPFPPMEDPIGPYTIQSRKSRDSLVAVFLRSFLPHGEPLYDRFIELINVLRAWDRTLEETGEE